MKMSSMKVVLALSCGLLAVTANAAPEEKASFKPFADADHVIYAPIRGGQVPSLDKSQLTNHGGGVLATPRVVFLFWGSVFCSGGSQTAYASTLQAFRNQFGSTGEFKTI